MTAPAKTRPVEVAVIPAAGLGTRTLPASKAVPKEMLPIVDTPAIELVIEEALEAGVRDIVLVTSRGKGVMEDHFDRAPELERALEDKGKSEALETVRRSAEINVVSVRQKQPLGLGHAVLCARSVVGDRSFAVLLPDDLIDHHEGGVAQLCRAYRETGRSAVSILEVPAGSEDRYGIVAGPADEDGRIAVETMVEKPNPEDAPSRWGIVGRYVLDAAIWPLLEATTPGAGGEIQLTDALAGLAARGALVGVPLEGVRHDIGNPLGFLAANIHYGLASESLREPLMALLRERVETEGPAGDG